MSSFCNLCLALSFPIGSLKMYYILLALVLDKIRNHDKGCFNFGWKFEIGHIGSQFRNPYLVFLKHQLWLQWLFLLTSCTGLTFTIVRMVAQCYDFTWVGCLLSVCIVSEGPLACCRPNLFNWRGVIFWLEYQNWSREETDQLFDMCERFDMRFIIIADRFSPPRTVEELKHRYYSGKVLSFMLLISCMQWTGHFGSCYPVIRRIWTLKQSTCFPN